MQLKFFVISLVLFINACSNVTVDHENDLMTYEQKRYDGFGKLFKSNPLTWSTNNKTKDSLNKLSLWKVALNTVSSMPILTANYQEGIILTDWYISPYLEKEKIKIDIMISETDKTELRISVFRKNSKDQELAELLYKKIMTQLG